MIESERSSGNVFKDMDAPDAENMKVRAELIDLVYGRYQVAVGGCLRT